MKKIFTSLLFATLITLTGCGTSSKVPLTGRTQRLLVSDAQVLSLSSEQYTSYMKTAKASTDKKNTEMVKRVGQKLATAVEKYLTANGYAEDVKNFSWEFNLVQDATANAFCMPGGKIVVYEGLLPITKDESSLAIVLGHEIAHAVARHSAEQLTSQLKAQYGAQAANYILGAVGGGQWQQIGNAAFSFGSNSLLRKFSRSNESEADYMGLVFAAMAGYNPAVAVDFWQRMASNSSSSTPEFFSDHPSDATRIANIQRWLPEAQKYYTGTSK
ncbi:MAG: M48 family metallopeptidase [Alloprevotella sp.]|nr:M48 family metallopeptidase [Alloprevotella sp.]